MKAIGWNYPPKNSLQILVERAGLHPLTSLTTLSDSQKRQLIDKGIVLCKEIADDVTVLRSLKISEEKTARIIKEINELLKSHRA
jgi:hypothetical protein